MWTFEQSSGFNCNIAVLVTAITIATSSHCAYAFAFGDHNQKMATDIDATDGIICDQQDNKCVAKGNVRVNRGQALLTTDQLTAFFKKNDISPQPQKLSRFSADGHVVITMRQQNQRATSDHAIYDMETGELIMTGDNLRLQSDDLIVTAKDSIKYFEKEQTATASGQATAQQRDRTITADVLRAVFTKADDGKMQVEHFFADGNVVITTSHETAHGEHGQYDRLTNIMTLEGNVRIGYQNGPNDLQLRGQRAEMNMTTGRSRLLASNKSTSGSNNKVKVLLTPQPSSTAAQ